MTNTKSFYLKIEIGGIAQPLMPNTKSLYLKIETDERLVSDLPRDRGRSIGGDLNMGEEGFEQTIVTLQSLHHDYVGYQHVRT
jgi:hypothetical protein